MFPSLTAPTSANLSTSASSNATWHSEPNGRGSWTILTSSLITIGLCAWTALHLNVPEYGHQYLWPRKTKWFVLGILAPEIVAFSAWRQRIEARNIQRAYETHSSRNNLVQIVQHLKAWFWPKANKKQQDLPPSRDPSKTGTDWTLTHGFYAIMGGFAMQPSPGSERFLPGDLERVTLTPKGLHFLSQHAPALVPNISKEEIEDKSKADGLKKALVCFQALWFWTSSISRIVKGLPISLLELNACAHAACALLIYCFWWSKPLDIMEPTTIRSGGFGDEMLAYMVMESHLTIGIEGFQGHDVRGGLRNEFMAIWPFETPPLSKLIFRDQGAAGPDKVTPCGEDPNCDNNVAPRVHPIESTKAARPISLRSDAKTHAPIDQRVIEDRRVKYSQSGYAVKEHVVNYLNSRLPAHILPQRRRYPAGFGVRNTTVSHISAATITRWRLASRAIERAQLVQKTHQDHALRSDFAFQNFGSKFSPLANYVLTRIPNHAVLLPYENTVAAPLHDDHEPIIPSAAVPTQTPAAISAYSIYLGFLLAGLIYGGLHCAAWNAPFATMIEQTLWRLSAAAVVLTPVAMTPLAAFAARPAMGGGMLKWRYRRRGRRVWTGAMRSGKVVGGKWEDVEQRQDPEDGETRVRMRWRATLGYIEPILMVFVVMVACVSPFLIAGYVLGRVYLVVECFLNLWHLPPTAFETVDWPGYVPHIA